MRHHNGDTEDSIMVLVASKPKKRWDPIEDCWVHEEQKPLPSDTWGEHASGTGSLYDILKIRID